MLRPRLTTAIRTADTTCGPKTPAPLRSIARGPDRQFSDVQTANPTQRDPGMLTPAPASPSHTETNQFPANRRKMLTDRTAKPVMAIERRSHIRIQTASALEIARAYAGQRGIRMNPPMSGPIAKSRCGTAYVAAAVEPFMAVMT